jgi:UDP-glucose 4-epimerase
MSRNVLVTGGAGFIGSHVAEAHLAEGDRVWVVDDLSSGRESNVPAGAELHRMQIGDASLEQLFDTVRFDLVSHHAAQIDVRVSVTDPRRDARTNVDGLLNVLENARGTGAGWCTSPAAASSTASRRLARRRRRRPSCPRARTA